MHIRSCPACPGSCTLSGVSAPPPSPPSPPPEPEQPDSSPWFAHEPWPSEPIPPEEPEPPAPEPPAPEPPAPEFERSQPPGSQAPPYSESQWGSQTPWGTQQQPQWGQQPSPGAQPQWGSPPPWGQQPAQPPVRPRRGGSGVRGAALVASLLLVAAVCLVTAVVAGMEARAEQTRPPTAAERSQAAAAAVADRWQRWPTGMIFPASLSYTTSLLTQETARRIGIGPGYACSAALAGPVAGLARRDGCRAAVRATYADQLQGVLFTTGVLAFPTPERAAAFARAIAADRLPAGLRALAFPRTVSARFDDAARQVTTRRQAGPYVVITVAGYADGRPAAAAQRRSSVFAPSRQLTSAILTPLAKPATVNCANPEWSC